MIKLKHIPKGLKEINKYYGNPDRDGNFELDPGWVQSHLTRFKLPFKMKLSWKNQYVTHILAHYLVGPSMIDALNEIKNFWGLDYLKENKFDIIGGVYNFRKMTSYPALSTHSWGMSIDINPHLGAYGSISHMPDFIVNAFKKRGFNWGGDWPPKWAGDPMHFQSCVGY